MAAIPTATRVQHADAAAAAYPTASPAHATSSAAAASQKRQLQQQSQAQPQQPAQPAQPQQPSVKQLLLHWDESSALDSSSTAAVNQINLLLTSRAADTERSHMHRSDSDDSKAQQQQQMTQHKHAAGVQPVGSLLEQLAQREAQVSLAQFASSRAQQPSSTVAAAAAPAPAAPAFSHAALLSLLLSAQLYTTTPASLTHLTPADAVGAERTLIEAGFPVQPQTVTATTNAPSMSTNDASTAVVPAASTGSSSSSRSGGLSRHQRHLLYYLQLRSASSSLASLQQTTLGLSAGAQKLLSLFGAVFTKTNSVREECAALLASQQSLASETLKFQFHLSYFLEIDSVQAKLADQRAQPVLAAFMQHHAGEQNEQAIRTKGAAVAGGLNGAALAVLPLQLAARNPMQSPEFPHVLSALDACLDYMRANADFLDAAPTRARLERLHASVLRAARNYVRECMEAAVRVGMDEAAKAQQQQQQQQAAPSQSGTPASPPPSSLSRRMHVQTQLRALSRSLKPLLLEMEHRAFVHEGGIFGAGISSPGGGSGATALAPVSAAVVGVNGEGPPSLQPAFYKDLLLEWYRLYCTMRHGLLYADLQAQLSQLLAGATAAFASSSASNPSKRPNSSILPDVVRSACASVMDVCAVEAQLFGEFFSVNGLSSAALNELLAALCGLLYTTLRPSVIRETDLDALVEVSCVLRGEVRERVAQATQGARRAQQGKAPVLLPPAGAAASSSSSSFSSSSSSSSASLSSLDLDLHPSHALFSFASSVARLTADVQERLSHRAQLYIRDVLQNHQTTPAELDYPNKLLQKEQESKLQAAAEAKQSLAFDPSGASLSPPPSSSSRRGGGALLSQWHPVLERTLLLLSKLYRSVDASVFKYLASEAIGQCTATILQAGVDIARRHAQTDPQMCDGLLFSISHMLLLREQLSPFASVDLEVSGLDLDLSHMRDVLPNIFSSVGKWSSFMDLVSESAPRVRERRTDSRKHLEAQLKSACEQLIASQTQALLGPLLAFFTRMGSAAQDQTATHGPEHFKQELVGIVAGMTGRPPPGSSAAAASSSLGSSLATPPSPFGTHLSLMLHRSHLYLLNPPTERVLFRPIHRSLVEVFEQLAFFVSTHFKDDAAAAAGGSSAAPAAAAGDALTVYLQESIAQLTHIVQDNFRE